jgi:hypothetical protein
MVLKGTVDNNIFQIAQRKLRLDKEVLEVSTRGPVLLCATASVCRSSLELAPCQQIVCAVVGCVCSDVSGGYCLVMSI